MNVAEDTDNEIHSMPNFSSNISVKSNEIRMKVKKWKLLHYFPLCCMHNYY